MAKYIFFFAPANGGPETWLESDDFGKICVDARNAIRKGGEGRARFIIDGKMCPVSQAVQQFYVQNPEEGKPPLPMGEMESPTFDKDGNVAFLVEPPKLQE